MPSENVARILRSKTDLTADEISRLTDSEGWRIIYSQAERKPRDNRLQICMTGFSNSRKAELASIAIESGFRVVTGVTKNLEFLCVGEEPGPNKVKKAKEQNVPIITEQQFLKIVETGELPDEC